MDDQLQPASLTPPESSEPRPFFEVAELWLKVHRMNEDFFRGEARRAGAANTFFAMLLYSAVVTVLVAASAYFSFWLGAGGLANLFGSRSPRSNLPNQFELYLALFACLMPLIVLGGFYLGSGLYWLLARLFGGLGSFTAQTYLVSLFSVPLGILSQLLGLVPFVGGLASSALGVIQIVLWVVALKAVHNLTTGRAVLVTFIPILLACVLPFCLLLGLMLTDPAVGKVFQNINF